MQHKLMILGSMDEFVELVRAARKRGIYVVVCDGYPDGPAKRIADESFNVDVRETEAIAEICRREQVDGIITSFSDLLAECMVAIAHAAGIPCYSTPDRFRVLREKQLMKKMFDDLRISSPKAVIVRKEHIAEDVASLGFPLVVKPLNGYGSRGVYVLDTAEEICERFDEIAAYSSFECILAEEYNQGYEINMMNWIVDGNPIVLSIADREKSTEIPQAIPHVSRCAYPSRLAHLVHDEAREIVSSIAAYVGIENGPLSMQFFYSPDKGIQVCEAAGRLFGYEHELVTYASSLSIEELLIDYVYDYDALKDRLIHHTAFFEQHSAGLYFHGYEGNVADTQAAEELDSLEGVVETLLYYAPGETISHGVGAKPYVARYYIVAPDREALDVLTETIYSAAVVYDDSGNNLLYRNELTKY